MARPASHAYFESMNSEYIPKHNYFNYNTFKILYSGMEDQEYQNFLKIKNSYPSIWYGKCKIEDMSGSIFSTAPDFSMAIGVSADMKMTSGIAIKFKEKYNCTEIFKEQNIETGGLAFVKDRNADRFIYYLVIMPVYYACPTYYTIWKSMQKLKENVLKYQINKIAISHIGCGIAAGLTWDLVKPLIEYTFRDVFIEIHAYEGKSPCILNHDIEECYCFGYSLLPPELDNSTAESFNYNNQGAMIWNNEYYGPQEQKNNNFKFCDQADKENFSNYNRLLGRGNFWEYNNQATYCCNYCCQGGHNTYNTYNTQPVTTNGILGVANHPSTQQEEDVYNKYCIKVGNDYYVKYSTEDAANDYYGALY